MNTAMLNKLIFLALAFATTNPPTPNLCDLAGGRWCIECTGATCNPVDLSGWLCCSGGACVAVATQTDCTLGVVGWCDDYYETTNEAGTTVAICEDSQ